MALGRNASKEQMKTASAKPLTATTSSFKKTADRPSTWRIWATAARPHTLTASLCPCLVAAASARPPVSLLAAWTLFCVTIQIGTNLHNDYSDFVQGADTEKRIGQARATAMGWLTPMQTCTAATLSLTITFMSGVYLVHATDQWKNPVVWALILSSIFNAFAYTAGPYPLGYIGLEKASIAYTGLGDIFVFLYFGLVATWMLPYLMHCQGDVALPWNSIVLYGIQVGLLGTNIIVVNNMRDRHTDEGAGKMTTAVRFGRSFSEHEYKTCFGAAYTLVLIDLAQNRFALSRWLPFLSLYLAHREQTQVLKKEGSALNPHVGGTAKVQLAFCALLSIGLVLS